MFLSVGLDIPPSVVNIIPEPTKELGVILLTALVYPPEHKFKRTIYGGEFLDLSNITFGKFLNLEVPMSRGWKKNIDVLLEEIYGVPPTDDWIVSDWFGGLLAFFNWRENLYKKYKKLFNINSVDEPPSDKFFINSDPAHKWYDLLMVICDGDYSKIEYVTESKLGGVLNYLAWKKDMIDKENKIRKDELQRLSFKNKRHY